MKLIFAGTPEFAKTQLEALIHHPDFDVVSVYTQPDRPKGRGQNQTASPVKLLAQRHAIPVEQPINFKSKEALDTLRSYHADVMVVSAYGLLLPPTVLEIPNHGCINVHASLLPRFRGAAPIQHALLAGDTKTGITLMQMDAGLDTGDILCQRSLDILPNDHAASLTTKLSTLGANLLCDKLKEIVTSPSSMKQDNNLATHAPKISKQDGLIRWENLSASILRQIRAFYPWPGSYTYLNKECVKILSATNSLFASTLPPGTLVESNQDGLRVATLDHDVLITRLQKAGKKPMEAHQLKNFVAQLPANSIFTICK